MCTSSECTLKISKGTLVNVFFSGGGGGSINTMLSESCSGNALNSYIIHRYIKIYQSRISIICIILPIEIWYSDSVQDLSTEKLYTRAGIIWTME